MGFLSSKAGCSFTDAKGATSESLERIVLPPLKPEVFVSQRHEVNPAIALSLLKDIQTTIGVWQEVQRQTIQALQILYAQGPMVDGWLQPSRPTNADQLEPENSADTTIFRHGDTDALMQYVEAVENGYRESGAPDPYAASSYPSGDSPTCYRLCSLKEDGSIQSQACPPEQMAIVSAAIARHQKFKQLLSQKQLIESNLQQAVDSLTALRNGLQPN